MLKKEKILRSIVLLLFIGTITFIFYNSYLDGNESYEVSKGFYFSIKPILDIILPDRFNNVAFIRKLAHFTEFGVLSFELAFIFAVDKELKNGYGSLFISLLTALTDETIQMFTSRGSSIKDIWLDFAGVITAFLFYLLLCSIIKNIINFSKKAK